MMKDGENWAIVGNNGAGKTTFLKLVFGEFIPKFGGEVNWFGFRGLCQIEKIRRSLGYISAEYQNTYDRSVSGLDVVLSGFFSSIGLYESPSHMGRRIAFEWMDRLDISLLAKKSFHQMSYGEARYVLLARALVNNPEILILDEPCAGLDVPNRERFLRIAEGLGKSKTRLIFVTHRVEELMPSITHVMYLKNGGVFKKGPKKDMLTDHLLSEALDCEVALTENSGRYWITRCETS